MISSLIPTYICWLLAIELELILISNSFRKNKYETK